MIFPVKHSCFTQLFHFPNVGNASKTVPLTASSMQAITPISGTIVSQSVLQPALSPVLTEYKQYLQSCYNARVLAPADKYLPTLESPYINLTMIKKGCYNPEQRDEFTKLTLHGGVDQILQNKIPINIEDLLTPEDNGELIRFILVEGPPGIGKSTFAWEVCRRWDEIESLKIYHSVVLLKLREKWVLDATVLPDLFRCEYNCEMSKSISKEFIKTQGKNLLLVLDGFDEVSYHFHEKSVIKSLLCRQLLPECTIILTTRPSASHILRSVCQPLVGKHIEIIGFTEEERMKYINKVFSKESELQVNFLKYMFLVPHIKSMMYIPLNCAIIAKVYYESHHFTIPRTRTELYKVLTHCLLHRHLKESNYDMLPEGLNKEDLEKFKSLAKFAFDTHKGWPKVTFFKDDLPEGLVHFGFLNESTEMYACKGVEHTFSFLHLSLQEYLAAWYLANNYSIEFQMAYHRLAVDGCPTYKGDNLEEEGLISSLQKQRSSLVEPAIFLAGITGWKCDRSRWEMYLSRDTADVKDPSVLLCSLYEAQDPKIVSHYFSATSNDFCRREFSIGSSATHNGSTVIQTPYDCYALSYCLANSLDQFILYLGICNSSYSDILTALVQTLVIGLDDHCKSCKPRVKAIMFDLMVELPKECMLWLMKAKFLTELEEVCFRSLTKNDNIVAQDFVKSLVNLEVLEVYVRCILSWEWLTALKSITKLKVLRISSYGECSPPPADQRYWPVEHRLTEIVLGVKFPSNPLYDLQSPKDVLVDSVLKSVLRSNQIVTMVLPSISRETMAGVYSILLHCPSLTTLELMRTRLGYDGVLYICSALRNNTKLRHLVISDDSSCSTRILSSATVSYVERGPLPGKTTCTDFVLELSNILKENTTLEMLKISCGLIPPISESVDRPGEYVLWPGKFQQFNVGAISSDISPNLRRSFSLSDLTHPHVHFYWKFLFNTDFKKFVFSMVKEEEHYFFSPPSFTAPDINLLQPFSGLDPRLQECLGIPLLHQYVDKFKDT